MVPPSPRITDADEREQVMRAWRSAAVHVRVWRAASGRDWLALVLRIGGVTMLSMLWLVLLVPLGRPDIRAHGALGIALLIIWILGAVALLLLAFDAYRLFFVGLAVEALLRIRRCPACAHLLMGLEDDGAERVRCPECGAAWRLPPVTTD